MKKSLLLTTLLILSLSSFAQSLPRLVSQIDSFNWGGVLPRYDSTRLFYTGLRRDFDSTLLTRPTQTGDTPLIRVVQHFNSIDSITEVIRSEPQSGNLSKVLNTRDAQNRKTGAVTLWNNSGSWDTSNIEEYAFDTNNNIIEYTVGYPEVNKFKYWYQYDANNNWLGFYQARYDTLTLVWDTIERFVCAYDANNNRLSGTNLGPQSGGWQTFYADTNVYSGNNLIYTYNYGVSYGVYRLFRKDSNAYNSNNDMIYQLSWYPYLVVPPYLKTINTYDNAHHLTLSLSGFVSHPADSFTTVARYRATYNSHGQISSSLDDFSSDSGQTWNPGPIMGGAYMHRYHYEDEPIYVPEIAKNISTIELYPNPASSAITINVSFISPEQSQIAILDIKGNVMMQWNEAATKQLHKMIPLQFLSAGNYVLVLKSKGDTQSRMFTVNR